MKVLLGNNKACTMEEIRTMRIKVEDGTKRILQSVRIILDLNRI